MENEQILLEKSRSGDPDSFSLLIKEFYPKLFSFIQGKFDLHPSYINEIVQSSVIKSWDKIKQFKNESSFQTWLFSISKNEAINLIKKNSVSDSREIPYEQTSSENSDYFNESNRLSSNYVLNETAASFLEKKELINSYREILGVVFDNLSNEHSEIIRLAIEEDCSYKDISNRLGVPIGTVMSRLHSAKQKAQKIALKYAKQRTIWIDGLGRH